MLEHADAHKICPFPVGGARCDAAGSGQSFVAVSSASRRPGSGRAHASLISAVSWWGGNRPTSLAARFVSRRCRGRLRRRIRGTDSSRRAVDLDRAVEPVSDPAARWAAPFVLCHRRHPRPSLQNAPRNMGFRVGLAIVLANDIFATFTTLFTWPHREPCPSATH